MASADATPSEPPPPPPPSLVCAIGSETTALSDDEIHSQINSLLDALGPREDVLILPPDYTRFHSQSGKITSMIAEHYGYIKNTDESAQRPVPNVQILPALGTHAPMTQEQIHSMFGEDLASKDPSPFLVHDWRNDVETIGYVPEQMVRVGVFLSSLERKRLEYFSDAAVCFCYLICNRPRSATPPMAWSKSLGRHN
jgi:nickel-dependent lactate racemase